MTSRAGVYSQLSFRCLLIRYPVISPINFTINHECRYNGTAAVQGGGIVHLNKNICWSLTIQKNYCSKASSSIDSDNVSIEYINGFPHFTIPLPSRNEQCRFALKPLSHTVGHFIEMLKVEDRGIDRATILSNNGIRIASSCNIESILDEPFWIHINDKKYFVEPPKRSKIILEDLKNLDNLRNLVGQLYEALNVGEYYVQKEQELVRRLEDLKSKLMPMEYEKAELAEQSRRKTTFLNWFGLSMMSVQFGILARLTWWEYSWDIMEPVTYFVTYGTAMAMYAYYCITRTEYNMPEVNNRQYLLAIYRRAKKKNFNIDDYNNLKQQIAEIEYDLNRLRDPLNVQLPSHINRSQRNTLQNNVYTTDLGGSITVETSTTQTEPKNKKPFINLSFLTPKS